MLTTAPAQEILCLFAWGTQIGSHISLYEQFYSPEKLCNVDSTDELAWLLALSRFISSLTHYIFFKCIWRSNSKIWKTLFYNTELIRSWRWQILPTLVGRKREEIDVLASHYYCRANWQGYYIPHNGATVFLEEYFGGIFWWAGRERKLMCLPVTTKILIHTPTISRKLFKKNISLIKYQIRL